MVRYAATLLVGAALAAASPPGGRPLTSNFESVGELSPVDGLTQAEEISFQDDGSERMTVPVELEGRGPYRFLVDTGADHTALSKEVADILQLPRGTDATLHSIAGTQRVETVTVPSLRLTSTPIRVRNVPLLSGEHMGADGILGVDSLKSQRVVFDFKSNTMSIVPSAQRLLPVDKVGDTIVVTARQRGGRLVLTKARANSTVVSLILDTGAQVTIGNSALRKRLVRANGGVKDLMKTVRLKSVTGHALEGEYLVLKRLDIGGATIRNLAVVFADAHTFRQLRLDKEPAILLGMDAMRVFDRVSIDFANRKLRLMMPEHSGALDGVRLASRQ